LALPLSLSLVVFCPKFALCISGHGHQCSAICHVSSSPSKCARLDHACLLHFKNQLAVNMPGVGSYSFIHSCGSLMFLWSRLSERVLH
jgi:hypothetical protein